MKTEMMKLADLKPYAGNAKKHDETQIKNVMQSIKDFGIIQPLVVDKDNVLIIGHCRLIACKRLKLKEAPVVRLEDLTEEQANKLRMLDNKLNESEWDFDLLAEQVPEIDFSEYDIEWDLPQNINPDDFGDEFSLPDGDKPEICQMTFTLHQEQKSLIEYAISLVENDVSQTFGNTNKNGNALYEVVKQWAEQRK